VSELEKPTSFWRLDLAPSSGGMHIFISGLKFYNVSETVSPLSSSGTGKRRTYTVRPNTQWTKPQV